MRKLIIAFAMAVTCTSAHATMHGGCAWQAWRYDPATNHSTPLTRPMPPEVCVKYATRHFGLGHDANIYCDCDTIEEMKALMAPPTCTLSNGKTGVLVFNPNDGSPNSCAEKGE
jgi:hypothetical protein